MDKRNNLTAARDMASSKEPKKTASASGPTPDEQACGKKCGHPRTPVTSLAVDVDKVRSIGERTSATPSAVRVFAVAAAVAGIACLVRGAFFLSFRESPLFEPFKGGHDRFLYHEIARSHYFPPGAFDYLPLYPMLLRTVYAVTGASLEAAAALGVLLDTATTALIAMGAAKLGAPLWTAALCALFYALYPLAIAYSAVTMPNTLNAFMTAAFLAGALAIPSANRWRAPALGFWAGLSALGWAGWLLAAPAFLTAEIVAFRHRRNLVTASLAFAIALALPIAPVAMHNTRAEGRFVLLSTHAGFNFYMGNHPRATGLPIRVGDFRLSARAMLEDAHRAAESAVGRSLSKAESSSWWTSRALEFWRDEPGRALALLGRKILLFWNARDIDDLRLAEQARLLGTGLPPNGVGFLPIAIAGWLGVWFAPRAAPLRAFFVGGMLAVVSAFITARYRLALAPVMLVLGAAAVPRLRELSRQRRFAAPALICLVGIAIAVVDPGVPELGQTDHYNAALQLQQAGRHEEALALADDGLGRYPDFAPLHFARGVSLHQLGRYADAARAFERCFALDPAHPNAAYNWALSLAKDGDLCGALTVLSNAAAIRPLEEKGRRLQADLAAFCPQSATP